MTKRTVMMMAICVLLAVTAGMAQNLESYRQKYDDAFKSISTEYQQQIEAITKSYASSLVALRARVQASGDLDKLKAVINEISRFQTAQAFPSAEDTVIPEIVAILKDCSVRITSIEHAKSKRIATLDEQYDQALLHLQKEYTRKGDLEKATKIQEERKSLAETNTHTGGGTSSEKTNGERQALSSSQVIDFFGLPPASAIDSNTIRLNLGKGEYRIFKSKPIVASSIEYGFEIRAKWYHIIGVEIDGVRYSYSRGHWKNTGTMVEEGPQIRRMRDSSMRIASASQFVPIAIKLEKGTLTWVYNGKVVDRSQVQVTGKPYSLSLLFGCYEAELQIRDVYLTNAGQVPQPRESTVTPSVSRPSHRRTPAASDSVPIIEPLGIGIATMRVSPPSSDSSQVHKAEVKPPASGEITNIELDKALVDAERYVVAVSLHGQQCMNCKRKGLLGYHP